MTALSVLVALALLPGGGWPVDSPHLMSEFRPPEATWASGHRGIDLAADTGDRVLAMAAGTVAFVGAVGGKPVVTVRHPDGRRTTYEPVVATVAAGAEVGTGDVIGRVAAAGGHCGGGRGCLHVGLRAGEAYLDPRNLLSRPPAVLKPG
jgi:murein DD-endopeptidase MepM/ murein hydrolase activator NlpD